MREQSQPWWYCGQVPLDANFDLMLSKIACINFKAKLFYDICNYGKISATMFSAMRNPNISSERAENDS